MIKEPVYIKDFGWEGGYSFKLFWHNCSLLLGDIAKLEGIQKLCHVYYLSNGSLSARTTAQRIKKFINH